MPDMKENNFYFFIYDKKEMEQVAETDAKERLLKEMEQHGVRLKQWKPNGEFTWNKSVFFTTVQKRAELVSRYGAAVVAYEAPGSGGGFWHGADMVLQGLEEVDYEFLNRVYLRKHRLPWNILTTERCLIREMTVEDLDALYALYSEPKITDYVEPLYPPEKEREYIASYIENMYRYFGYGIWLIVQKESGRVIGRAGFEEVEVNGHVKTELGYLIAADLQRQGYAREVCSALLEYGKQYHRFEEIICRIAPSNTPSIALAKALGFEYEQELWQGNNHFLQYRIRL